MSFRESDSYRARVAAAGLGCGICGGHVIEPVNGGDPFSSGPYQGRYWCSDCWTLYWDEHPEHLADDPSRRYVASEARKIRHKREAAGWELLYEEGDNRAYLTDRGTLLLQRAEREGYGAGEYHPEDFQLLLRVLAEVDRKAIPGFTFSSVPADTPL